MVHEVQALFQNSNSVVFAGSEQINLELVCKLFDSFHVNSFLDDILNHLSKLGFKLLTFVGGEDSFQSYGEGHHLGFVKT
jgi:hypothetical protein